MERSRYLGRSMDLYIQDHFMGAIAGAYPELINHKGFTVSEAVDYECSNPAMPPGRALVRATVTSAVGEDHEFAFVMMKAPLGKYKGCWQTHRLLRGDDEWLGQI